MTEPLNPLRPTLAEGTWFTRDARFLAAPYLFGKHRRAGHWLIEFHPFGSSPNGVVLRVTAADREHAQQVVDQITWALTDGARPAISATPTKGIL
ncbi:hypothetical protein [Nocardia wallacei]|uniref:DUF317 domain-containing protein n=1 Tax=Nocardia wallacei TaxID=480035 RepID=A0A7G1KTX6_9NOCA|nr:hypothetical protein [Nocardia wallacei]BCK58381.1 hypothetical protein NWFMUON74_61530 [Nocardia wallacei]